MTFPTSSSGSTIWIRNLIASARSRAFCAEAEIADNDYDLSINKYKTVEYVVEKYLSTDEIMTKIENIEQDIILGLAELRAML